MKESHWITQTVIHAMHEELLARFGGLSGIRDEGLLESALGRPQNVFAYGEPTMCKLAAEYAACIVKTHPFLDGSKRTGFMAAYVFLLANGLTFSSSEGMVVVQTRALAAGEIDGAENAAWLEASCASAE